MDVVDGLPDVSGLPEIAVVAVAVRTCPRRGRRGHATHRGTVGLRPRLVGVMATRACLFLGLPVVLV
jgi:hypothetical protein